MEILLVMKILLKMRNFINYQQFLTKYSNITIVIIVRKTFKVLHIIYKNLPNVQSLHISPNVIPFLSNIV